MALETCFKTFVIDKSNMIFPPYCTLPPTRQQKAVSPPQSVQPPGPLAARPVPGAACSPLWPLLGAYSSSATSACSTAT